MDLYAIRKDLNMGIPLTKIKLRATIYARVSTEHQDQKKSLQNQIEHFEQYIKKNKNWTYIKGYIDEGITGTSDVKRDNFMKMIEDAHKNKFDLIITKEISRFSRNTLDSIKYVRLLLSYGVAVLFINDNINTALQDSELRLTIMASMAQDEIRRLSQRVKFGMNQAMKRGEILGNNMLYGYQKDKSTGNLNIIEKEAVIVKKIYELYAIEELSLTKISKLLNHENLKTKTGKKWSVSTIARMIENPKYKGYYCAHKTEIIDYMTKKIKYIDNNNWITYEDKQKIPPLIDDNLWERANIRLNKRKKSFTNRKKDKNIYKNRYLYSTKIYCAEHNTVFHRREFRKNKKDITWICSEYLKKGKSFCDSPNIRESELNYIFKDLILNLQINLTKVIPILMDFYSKDKNINFLKNRIKNLSKEKLLINQKKDKILELNMKGILSNKEFYERNNSLNEELKKVETKLEKLHKENQEKFITRNKFLKIENIILKKLNSKLITEKLIKLLLEKIVVSKINHNKNNIELNIYISYKGNNHYQNNKPFLKKNYNFKRGYDTTNTARYTITYITNYYFSISDFLI